MTPRRHRRLVDIADRRQPDLTVLMDNVHKPHNVSAVLRTCDAVGIPEIHAVSPDPDFRAKHHSASGSGRYVEVQTHADHATAAAVLHERGFQILAAHLTPEAVDFRRVDYTKPTAILLGSERDGVGSDAATHADGAIVIPMVGAVASLNVSVAAAVILFEAQRQREDAGFYDTPRLDAALRARLLFEWGHPKLADFCRRKGIRYPALGDDGEVIGPLPRG